MQILPKHCGGYQRNVSQQPLSAPSLPKVPSLPQKPLAREEDAEQRQTRLP